MVSSQVVWRRRCWTGKVRLMFAGGRPAPFAMNLSPTSSKASAYRLTTTLSRSLCLLKHGRRTIAITRPSRYGTKVTSVDLIPSVLVIHLALAKARRTSRAISIYGPVTNVAYLSAAYLCHDAAVANLKARIHVLASRVGGEPDVSQRLNRHASLHYPS